MSLIDRAVTTMPCAKVFSWVGPATWTNLQLRLVGT